MRLLLCLLLIGCSLNDVAPPRRNLVILGDSTASHLQRSETLAQLKTLYNVKFLDLPPGVKSLRAYADTAFDFSDADILLVLAGGHDFLYQYRDRDARAVDASRIAAAYLGQRTDPASTFVWFDTSTLREWDAGLRVDEWHLNDKGYAVLLQTLGLLSDCNSVKMRDITSANQEANP